MTPGREITRDVIGALKRHGLIDGALRAPEPGAPYAYVTTKKFLEVFALASLRELPDIEKLEDAGLLQRPASTADLDVVLGLREKTVEPMDQADDDLLRWAAHFLSSGCRKRYLSRSGGIWSSSHFVIKYWNKLYRMDCLLVQQPRLP